eukprot:219999-Chlamydomonas_euryale.AAC.2
MSTCRPGERRTSGGGKRGHAVVDPVWFSGAECVKSSCEAHSEWEDFTNPLTCTQVQSKIPACSQFTYRSRLGTPAGVGRCDKGRDRLAWTAFLAVLWERLGCSPDVNTQPEAALMSTPSRRQP